MRIFFLAIALLFMSACSASRDVAPVSLPTATVAAAAPAGGGVSPVSAPTSSASGTPASVGSAAGEPTAPFAPSSSACPADMVLVDGEYCSEVENECKRSWYDK